MAAPSQSSPDQASQTSNKATTEEVAPASVATADLPAKDPPTTIRRTQELTYAGTEASDAVLVAKRLLSDGAFDETLEIIGLAMTTTISLLPEDVEPSLHESMAPLYYMYGTTLLYSIEESNDNLHNNSVAGNNEEDEEEADDSQIAWENLESARHIVQTMVLSNPDDHKLQLDLAQIHLRLGDLQRSNGRYQEAVSDYTACLEIRQPVLGVYDRKVAEMHHLLGLVYMMLASEGDKQQDQPSAEAAALMPEAVDESGSVLTSEQIEHYRATSIAHYVACGKSFAGQIAFLCGVDPETITADATNEEQGGKTTGMDLADLARRASSNTIRVIRSRVAGLQSSNDSETVHDYKELLDEIQETIDEAENSKAGIKEVSEMKAKLHAEIAASDAAEIGDGFTTTIGFGTTQPTAKANGDASAAVPSIVSGAPMMIIKKKKKRDEEDGMVADAASKRGKTE